MILTKHDNMRSFSPTHYLQLALRRRYDTGGALQQGPLNSKIATGCTQSELASQDAKSSWDPPSESKSYGETWNNGVDFRIPGIPFSTDEQQDTTRKNKVKKLIEKFENHQHKESFFHDLSQTQKINKFSELSQDLIADMSNTEIFELCENSTQQQAMSCLQFLLGNWKILSQLWMKCEIFAETNRIRAEQIRRLLNPSLCYQEEQQSRCQTRTS